ncbi:MAG: acyl-CoA dehydrogenase [Chloroflexi bacterium]|nr:acyl-CoA dehydrogenase [Chloroflexota bacterium]
MDLGLSEIQQMLKNSAREFLSQECPLTLVREMEEDDRGFTDELWRQISGLGWPGIAFPEQYGGTGGSFLDLTVLLEEIGRSLTPGPFFSTVVLGGFTVLDAGTDEQKRDILPGICSGQTLMTLALTEASATYEPWGVETTATREGDSFRIDGQKLFVPDAHAADVLLVAARTTRSEDLSQGITLFFVNASAPGLTVNQLSTISSDRQCEITLDGVTVAAQAVLGEVDQGWPIIQRALQRAIAGKCVEMLGGADAVVEMTVEYAKQRAQFGRPVGTFQAVQHHCANMATDVEGCRQIAYHAAWKISEGDSADREVAMAKAWVSGAYQRVCNLAHQCHGAIGFTREHDLQLYTRRAKVQELTYGDVNFHKEIAMREIEA